MPQNSIYKKLGEVMKRVERVPKNGYNSFHKYYYTTESDLTESIRFILLESGLAFFTNVLEQEREGEFTKVKMEFTLVDMDTGETLKSIFWGEGQDKGDKGLYKAYTGATKYFLMKTFLIPTGDDPEQNEQPSNNPHKQYTQQTPQKKYTQQTPQNKQQTPQKQYTQQPLQKQHNDAFQQKLTQAKKLAKDYHGIKDTAGWQALVQGTMKIPENKLTETDIDSLTEILKQPPQPLEIDEKELDRIFAGQDRKSLVSK